MNELDDLLGGPRIELSEVLSHVLDKGVVLRGEVMLAVADIDLIKLDLGLLLTAVESALRQQRRVRRSGGEFVRDLGELPDSAQSEVVRALKPPSDTPITPLAEVAEALPPRLNTDPEKAENGLAKLVLTLIEVLRKVLEHQAVRRMEGGHLSEAEIEKLGVALLRLNDRMQEMKEIFGLTDEDLQIDLGPLGKLR
ncbi:MAG TPA: gas vesicle protein GvpJ [Gemmatimonadaceae bacterium]|nr:gas vesicle protein GvpJ [Gemmatimonadaceae bacterium]